MEHYDGVGSRWTHDDSAHHGHAMNDQHSDTITFVVGPHFIVIELDVQDVPRSLGVTLHLDGRRLRSFEEPGWRSLGYGLSDRHFYWWSARRLMTLALPYPSGDLDSHLDQFDVDEDILEVFSFAHSWLFVCETSLRLVTGHREAGRLEYPEVILEAYLKGDQIVVQEVGGRQSRVDIHDHTLRLVDR
jgi:hypothetical protein